MPDALKFLGYFYPGFYMGKSYNKNMKVALIEFSEEPLAEQFQREIIKQADTVDFVYKKASDLLNILAFAKQLGEEVDYIVIIADVSEQKSENKAFYNGLAEFQVQTGKQVFKLLIEPDEPADVIEFANDFIDAAFNRTRTKESAKEEDLLEM